MRVRKTRHHAPARTHTHAHARTHTHTQLHITAAIYVCTFVLFETASFSARGRHVLFTLVAALVALVLSMLHGQSDVLFGFWSAHNVINARLSYLAGVLNVHAPEK